MGEGRVSGEICCKEKRKKSIINTLNTFYFYEYCEIHHEALLHFTTLKGTFKMQSPARIVSEANRDLNLAKERC